MPRPPRLQEPGYLHHVIVRGIDRMPLFRAPVDYGRFAELWNSIRCDHEVDIYNYAMIPNHVHLLMSPRKDEAMSRAIQFVSGEYGRYFNAKYSHKGHVFEGRYKSFVVQEERYFFVCSRYIDMNPVKAGLVARPEDYPWSAYMALAHGGSSAIKIQHHPLYEELSPDSAARREAYRDIVGMKRGEDFDFEAERQRTLGDAAFRGSLKFRKSI